MERQTEEAGVSEGSEARRLYHLGTDTPTRFGEELFAKALAMLAQLEQGEPLPSPGEAPPPSDAPPERRSPGGLILP